MPARHLRIADVSADVARDVHAALVGVRQRLAVPEGYPAAALREAQSAADRAQQPRDDAYDSERVDLRQLSFVTVDPAGSQDLDQAACLERTADGFTVHYAIADVAAFVAPGGALDAQTRDRVLTLYGPDERTPLHPPVLSEGAASLLPDVDRRAVVWRLSLDVTGAITEVSVRRAWVRSRAKLSYEEVQRALDRRNGGDDAQSPECPPALIDSFAVLLAEVGTARQAQERARGGVSLDVPEQVVTQRPDGSVAVEFRRVLPVESYNAQLSLATGIAAAEMMVRAGAGIVRTLPQAAEADIDRLRDVAIALGVPWPAGASYADVLAVLDTRLAPHAAFAQEATRLFRGAGYAVLTEPVSPEAEHVRHGALASVYAHVTAPLRRLVDRFATEVCLAIAADQPVPRWVREALDGLPATMHDGNKRAGAYEKATLAVLEAALLADRIGEEFSAVALSSKEVVLDDVAVSARLANGTTARPGTRVRVAVLAADVMEGTVTLEPIVTAGAGEDAPGEAGAGGPASGSESGGDGHGGTQN